MKERSVSARDVEGRQIILQPTHLLVCSNISHECGKVARMFDPPKLTLHCHLANVSI